MCLSLQGNLYIFIVGHSEGTVLRLLPFRKETENRPLSPFFYILLVGVVVEISLYQDDGGSLVS